jgi:hypothetical protein
MILFKLRNKNLVQNSKELINILSQAFDVHNLNLIETPSSSMLRSLKNTKKILKEYTNSIQKFFKNDNYNQALKK